MKKIIYIIIFLCLIFGTNNYQELNSIAIITNVGIEKHKDNYSMTYQEIIPVRENDTINNRYKYYTSTGENLEECMKKLDEKIVKKVYLEHLENIIINTDSKEIILNLDHIFSDEEDNFNIFITDNTVKDIIKYSNNYKYINSLVDKKITYKKIKINEYEHRKSLIPVIGIKNKNLIFYKYKNLGDIND